MGAVSSFPLKAINDNPFIKKLIGEDPISEDDQFWDGLLLFSFTIPTTSPESKVFDEAMQPICKAFGFNTRKSGNLKTLVKVCVTQLIGLLDNSKSQSNEYTWKAYNSLLLVQVVCKYLLERFADDEVVQILEDPLTESDNTMPASLPVTPTSKNTTAISSNNLSTSLPTTPLKGSVPHLSEAMTAQKLVSALIEVITEVQLLPQTYDIHLMAMTCLITLMSQQLFQSRPASQGFFVSHIMNMPQAVANKIVKTMLYYYITEPHPPPPDFRQKYGVISSLTSGLWSWISPSAVKSDKTSSPLALQSQLLLLILVIYSPGGPKGQNPFRKALFSFTEEGDRDGVDRSQTFGVEMEKLYLTLCKQVQREGSSLLLYFLLHGNNNMSSFIFSRSDIECLVLPILEQLHKSDEGSSHHLYMMLIILLILSQDEVFSKSIHEISIPKVPWYTERKLTNITLGGLIIIVVIRTLQVNMSTMRDKYLHTNCLAALANMSAHFNQLQLLPAQRLVDLFKLLSKKHKKLLVKIKEFVPGQKPAAEEPDYTGDLAIVEEVMRMILEIINSSLSKNLKGNPHLVYSILHQHESFQSFRLHPAFSDIISNIEMIVAHFNSKIEEKGQTPQSSQEMMQIVDQASKTWSKSKLRSFPELKFKYVEEDHPDEFFIPYVWSLVYCHSGLYWDGERIQLQYIQEVASDVTDKETAKRTPL